MEDKKVSVIIPTYNREKTISRCIDSVLKQTYKNIEIVIIDDCSNDNTEQIILNLSNNNDKIKYYKLPNNKGACYARNYGIRKSTGDYIALLDSDDEWYAKKIEKQVTFLEENQHVDMVYCLMETQKIDNTIVRKQIVLANPTNEAILKNLLYSNFIGMITIMLRKYVCERVKFDESLKRFQDWDFLLRICNVYKVAGINEYLCKCYKQSNSITSSVDLYDSLIAIYCKHKNLFGLNPDADAFQLYRLARAIEVKDNKKAAEYYISSLKRKPMLKTLLYYLKMGLCKNA